MPRKSPSKPKHQRKPSNREPDRSAELKAQNKSKTLLRYESLLTDAEMEQLRDAIERPLLPAIRINTLKVSPGEAVQNWRKWYGWELRQVPFCPEGWQFLNEADNISRSVENRMGVYYIQDAASMLPVEMFDFHDTYAPLVLDMAAAPGGKTTHLVSRANDRGLVVANDSNSQRIGSLQANLARWGATSTVVTNQVGERLGSWLPELFDKVLLDTPCSGEALRTSERHQTRSVSPYERSSLQKRQVNLLKSAFQATRPGGLIVYATCSLAPEEDEAVLDALLRLFPQQAVIEKAGRLSMISAPGVTRYEGAVYDESVQHAVRLWPYVCDTSGFFAARIRKQDSVLTEPKAPPSRPLSKAGYEQLSSMEQWEILSRLQDEYGFSWREAIPDGQIVMLRRNRMVYGIPELWMLRFADFPFESAGLVLGKQTGKGFQPSNELVSRFWPHFNGPKVEIPDDEVPPWLAGGDIFMSFPEPTGGGGKKMVLLEDSKHRFLGRGTAANGRIENMLPRWR